MRKLGYIVLVFPSIFLLSACAGDEKAASTPPAVASTQPAKKITSNYGRDINILTSKKWYRNTGVGPVILDLSVKDGVLSGSYTIPNNMGLSSYIGTDGTTAVLKKDGTVFMHLWSKSELKLNEWNEHEVKGTYTFRGTGNTENVTYLPYTK